MRLWEIEAVRFQPVATNRFEKNLRGFAGENNSVTRTLSDFLTFRKSHKPSEPYNAKDFLFSNKSLNKAIRHVHLVHGEIIVLYQELGGFLYLFDIVDHSAYRNSSATVALVKWLNGVSYTDFCPFGIKEPVVYTIPEKELQRCKEWFWEMADGDRDGLEQAAKGDFRDLMIYLDDIVKAKISPTEKEAKIIEAFGGRQAFIQEIKDVLKHTQVKESRTLEEDWQMVKTTPSFLRQIRAKAEDIAWDIADDLPKDAAEFRAMVVQLLRRIDAISDIDHTMTITRAELRRKQDIPNIKSVGAHWSWHNDSAKVYHHENAYDEHGKNLVEVVFVADVPFSAVNWVYTIATNLILPSEREITLKNGVTINITKVYIGDSPQSVDCNQRVTVSATYD